MRRLNFALLAGLTGITGLVTSGAFAAGPGGENAVDLSRYATKQSVDDAIAAMRSDSTVKQATIPAAGPGAGFCRQTIVPSELITSGGVTGTAGTCSRILQCGTSATYVVTQFNVGSGC